MKKALLFIAFGFVFSLVLNQETKAQTASDTVKKVGTATKDTAVAGAKKTAEGAKKGAELGKTGGQKLWGAAKGLGNLTYKAGKKVGEKTVEIVKKTT